MPHCIVNIRMHAALHVEHVNACFCSFIKSIGKTPAGSKQRSCTHQACTELRLCHVIATGHLCQVYKSDENVHEKHAKRSGGVSTHPAWALPGGLVAEPKRKVESREEPQLHRGLYSPRGNQVPPGMRFLNNAILHRVSPKSWQPELQNTFETSN